MLLTRVAMSCFGSPAVSPHGPLVINASARALHPMAVALLFGRTFLLQLIQGDSPKSLLQPPLGQCRLRTFPIAGTACAGLRATTGTELGPDPAGPLFLPWGQKSS